MKRVMLACACLMLASACGQGGGFAKKLAFVTNNGSDFWTIARDECSEENIMRLAVGGGEQVSE